MTFRVMLVTLLAACSAICQTSIWSSSARPGIPAVTDDTAAVSLGLKFYSDVQGTVTAVRFYKGTGNSGTHVAHLWSGSGTALASAAYANETATGWQQVNFPAPVSIQANTPYVISYLAPRGSYANDQYFGWSRVQSNPLHVAGSSPGVYAYGGTPRFPNETWRSSNYWVDLVFVPAGAPPAQSTYTISGNVRGSAATVTLSGTASGQVTTDAAGNYNFARLSNGSYVVAPSQPGFVFAPSTAVAIVNSGSVTAINFAAAIAPRRVTLSWNPSTSTGIAGYNLYRATAAAGPFAKLNTSLVPATSYVDTRVTSGQTYYYVATAVDSRSSESVYSGQASALVPSP